MLRRKDFEIELAKGIETLRSRKSHTKEEIDEIGRGLSVRIMKNPYMLAQFCHDNKLSLADSLTILSWVATQIPFLNDIDVKRDVSYQDAVTYFEQARVNTIIIHRVNFILHECMVQVYDALERDKRLKFGVKKAVGEAERPWNTYMNDRRQMIEKTAWYTMQDHLRLAYDAVSPYLEKVYESIRDYMISLGYRDVEIKARCAVVFLMAKVCGHTFRHFFEEYENECGIDYLRCFDDDDLRPMVSLFDNLCSVLGIGTEKDKHGFYQLKGFNPEKNQRFLWAWDDLIKALRDDDLMDDAAKKAIDLNPAVQKEYMQILDEENRKQVDAGIEQLSGKYKVTKGKDV